MREKIIIAIAVVEALLIACGFFVVGSYQKKVEQLSAVAETETAEAFPSAGVAEIPTDDFPQPEKDAEKETEEIGGELSSEEETEESAGEAPDFPPAEKLPTLTTFLTGEDITIIGDSISYMTKSQMEKALPGVDIHAYNGKTVDMDGEDNPCGLNLAATLETEGNLRDTVVFALGTNNTDAVRTNLLNEEMFEQLHETTGDRTVYLVTNYDMENPERYDANNEAIRAAAKKYDGWHVIDWADAVVSTGDPASYIEYEPDAVANMQVHPTNPKGIALWVETITKGLNE